jgi:hypothetical protein
MCSYGEQRVERASLYEKAWRPFLHGAPAEINVNSVTNHVMLVIDYFWKTEYLLLLHKIEQESVIRVASVPCSREFQLYHIGGTCFAVRCLTKHLCYVIFIIC